MPLPTVVTHIYDPVRGPFRNLCDLPDAEAERILDELRAAGRPTLRPGYLAKRRRAEAWLLAERCRRFGPPRLRHPLYFFLGDRADGLDPSRPAALVLPLAAFEPRMLTFTCPDSLACGPQSEVMTLEEVAVLVRRIGLPRAFGDFMEMQLWDERPLAPYRPQGSRYQTVSSGGRSGKVPCIRVASATVAASS